MPGLQDEIRLTRQGPPDPWLLVHFEPESMPGAVPERVF